MSARSRPDSGAKQSPYDDIGGTPGSANMSYMAIEPKLLQRAVETVVTRGDALVLGRTSDGGALSVRVLSDKQVFKWWPSNLDELQDLLEKLAG